MAGVKSLSLYEYGSDEAIKSSNHEGNGNTCFTDLAAQFYLNENDIGYNRSLVSVPKLSELNPYVNVSFLKGDINSIILDHKFTAVVLTETTLRKQIEISELCHNNNIAVVIGDARGVFGSVFCDFGNSFTVNDINGEPTVSSMIANISVLTTSADNISSDDNIVKAKILVTVLEDSRHNLETDDRITFTEISGSGIISMLNGNEYDVEVKDDPFSFLINVNINKELLSQESLYERGGYVNPIKKPKVISFKSFSKSIASPGEYLCDFMKMDQAAAMHRAFIAMHRLLQQL